MPYNGGMKWVLTGAFFFALTLSASAQEFNAGFVQGLWYGDEEVFADEPTRVYVAIRNNTGADLTGTVEFFDGERRIERNNVSALDNRIIESWADWTPGYGEHTITATLSRIELHQVGSSTQAVEVVSALAESIIFVDHDTDNDGVGNEEDKDDDGDSVSDATEIANGTDPLDADDPESDEDNSDESENEDDNSGGNNSDEDGGGSEASAPETSNSNEGPEGLEQYLTESRADGVFSSITDVVNNTKKRIDDYRETRINRSGDTNQEPPIEESNPSTGASTTASSTASSTEVDDSGFGEISRTTEEPSKGFFATIIGLAKSLVNSTYTFVLFLLSFYLGHPILVQLTLLILILFLLYKVARRLGNRQNY